MCGVNPVRQAENSGAIVEGDNVVVALVQFGVAGTVFSGFAEEAVVTSPFLAWPFIFLSFCPLTYGTSKIADSVEADADRPPISYEYLIGSHQSRPLWRVHERLEAR
jgi:hypothetical protein